MCLGFSSNAVGNGRVKVGDGDGDGDGYENTKIKESGTAAGNGFGTRSAESLRRVDGILSPDSMSTMNTDFSGGNMRRWHSRARNVAMRENWRKDGGNGLVGGGSGFLRSDG